MTFQIDPNLWVVPALRRLVPDFLPGRRWFAGKARQIQAVELEDAVLLDDERHPCVLIIADVRYGDGGRERYVLLLALADAAPDRSVIGPCDAGPPGTWLVEAAADLDVGPTLLRGFASALERPTLRGGTLRYADVSTAVGQAIAGMPAHGGISPMSAEQSNTSLRVGRDLIFKLFRKLDDGENPEVELGRFLASRTSFRATPRLQGSLTYTSATGQSSTLGVLQDWTENLGDGWRYVVERLQQPDGPTRMAPLMADLRTLGAITADFHAALAGDAASPEFAPEPVTAADLDTWQAAFVQRASQTLALVDRSLDGWPDGAGGLGRQLSARCARATLPRVPGITAASARFQKIRVHGDYHLGQTLKTADGFVLIDLEGEPGRPLAERRLKHCALKDVAGMIRSFDYAVATAAGDRPAPLDDPQSAPRLRTAFLDGYLSAAPEGGAVHLPADRRALGAWIDFFEVEKAFYELTYEINNRPAWAHIPLRGILRILEGPASTSGTG